MAIPIRSLAEGRAAMDLLTSKLDLYQGQVRQSWPYVCVCECVWMCECVREWASQWVNEFASVCAWLCVYMATHLRENRKKNGCNIFLFLFQHLYTLKLVMRFANMHISMIQTYMDTHNLRFRALCVRTKCSVGVIRSEAQKHVCVRACVCVRECVYVCVCACAC